MENKEIRIGLYLRVSSRERALLGYGLDAQEEKGLAYIKMMYDDRAIITKYIDDGVSAKDTNRHDFKKMMNDVKQNKIDMIVIYKLDRLARSVTDVYKTISFLMENNCNLVAVMDQLDIHSANGRMLVGILAIIAQWEREVIIERTMDGLNAMVAKGKYPLPGTPFGWKKSEDNYLSVDAKSSEILNFLADMVLEGYNLNDLKRVLNEDYKISKQASTIKDWLLRRINYGEFEYHEKMYDDVVPAIMNKTKYDNVKLVITRRSSKWDTSKYYYANRVYCSCGTIAVQKLTKKVNKNYYYYECPVCYKRMNQTELMKQTLSDIFVRSNNISMEALEIKTRKKIIMIDKKIKKIYKAYMSDEVDMKSYIYTLTMFQNEKDMLLNHLESVNVNAEVEFDRKDDVVKKGFIQGLISKIIVDFQLGIVLQVEYKTITK